MKKVVNGLELKEKMKEAINLLCGTVKTTLGPSGNNVIIDHSNFTPFITNDGVTIAQNIESDDEVINTILELTKEASIKTNLVVGDGTTTTLVLLEAIFNLGIKKIEDGINPLILKEELTDSLKEILNMIDEYKRPARKEDLFFVATNSANSQEMGKIVSEVYSKVKTRNSIIIKEVNQNKTSVNYIKGYTFDTVLASPYFLKSGEINLDNSYLMLVNDILDSLETISDVLNNIIKNNMSLVIIAKDYNSLVIEQILSLYLENNIRIILLKNPEFGLREYYFEQDIKAILENITNGSKQVKNITINQTKTTIIFNVNETIKSYLKYLKKIKNISDFDKNYFEDKISMFKNGIALVNIGANTNLERREAKMRYDDAFCALASCKDGVVPGSGIIYSNISDRLNNNSIGNEIFKEILLKPLEQLLHNSTIDEKIYKQIKNDNFNKLYNLKTFIFEDIKTTKVIDPVMVIKEALINATSIASMLLTTNCLIINEYKNSASKNLDYNEL